MHHRQICEKKISIKEHDIGRLGVDFVSTRRTRSMAKCGERSLIFDCMGLNRNLRRSDPLVSRPLGRQPMTQNKPDPVSSEAGKQVPARPHDTGSAANETVDGLDATTETLRKAAEDTPSGTGPGDLEKTPVFDRADLAPKI
jgi:hypothetical protein